MRVSELATCDYGPCADCLIQSRHCQCGRGFEASGGRSVTVAGASEAAGQGVDPDESDKAVLCAGGLGSVLGQHVGGSAGGQHLELRLGAGTYRPAEPDGDQTLSFVLDGDLNGDDGEPYFEYGDNARHVVVCENADTHVTLQGLTIRGGYIDPDVAYGEPPVANRNGAGILNFGATLGIDRCVLTQNFAAPMSAQPLPRGLALYNAGGDVTVSATRITENGLSVYSPLHDGAAVYSDGGSLTAYDCVWADGTGGFGAAVLAVGGDVLLQRCVVRDHQCLNAVHLEACTATVSNCLFVDNTDAALSPAGAELVVLNTTFAGQHTMSLGTGGGGQADAGSHVSVRNCILWNDAPQAEIFLSAESTVSVVFSDVQGGWSGVGNLGIDPLFVAPGAGVPAGFQLQADSPCVDAGAVGSPPDPAETDLIGHPRVLCDAVDMGACEWGVGDLDCDRDVDIRDWSAWFGCLTGPSIPAALPTCLGADADADGDVDLADYASLQAAFTGP